MLSKLLRSTLIGVLTAAILLVAVPSIRPIFIEHLINGDFLNAPFSYNKAVRRAAPAVVNVYSSTMGSFSQEGRELTSVSYTHLTLPTNTVTCRSRWSPYH